MSYGGARRRRLRALVREGYDTISEAYRSDDGTRDAGTDESTSQYGGWVDELSSLLEPGSRVLDLGCGNGLPGTRQLVEAGFAVTGIDFSPVQIERARELVPAATFIEADMVTWDCPPGSFDAIVSFYALIHVPIADQRELLPRLWGWLRPQGLILAIVGHQGWRGSEEYLGTPMFWDHADTQTYLRWFKKAGLEPIWHRFIAEGNGGHSLILAKALSKGEATPRTAPPRPPSLPERN